MLAYVRAFSVQIASSAIAFALYPIPQRLARWLLMAADRVGSKDIALTHDALSIMLGVRRAGVTVAVQTLVAQGSISARRGHITIVDRTTLLRQAGAGYGTAEREYDRLTSR